MTQSTEPAAPPAKEGAEINGIQIRTVHEGRSVAIVVRRSPHRSEVSVVVSDLKNPEPTKRVRSYTLADDENLPTLRLGGPES